MMMWIETVFYKKVYESAILKIKLFLHLSQKSTTSS